MKALDKFWQILQDNKILVLKKDHNVRIKLVDGRITEVGAGSKKYPFFDPTDWIEFNDWIQWVSYDPFYALEMAIYDGAIIEVLQYDEWREWNSYGLAWGSNPDHYRIKGGISIVDWKKNKEAIKQWWSGSIIEMTPEFDGLDIYEETSEPEWCVLNKYRVKKDASGEMSIVSRERQEELSLISTEFIEELTIEKL